MIIISFRCVFFFSIFLAGRENVPIWNWMLRRMLEEVNKNVSLMEISEAKWDDIIYGSWQNVMMSCTQESGAFTIPINSVRFQTIQATQIERPMAHRVPLTEWSSTNLESANKWATPSLGYPETEMRKNKIHQFNMFHIIYGSARYVLDGWIFCFRIISLLRS